MTNRNGFDPFKISLLITIIELIRGWSQTGSKKFLTVLWNISSLDFNFEKVAKYEYTLSLNNTFKAKESFQLSKINKTIFSHWNAVSSTIHLNNYAVNFALIIPASHLLVKTNFLFESVFDTIKAFSNRIANLKIGYQRKSHENKKLYTLSDWHEKKSFTVNTEDSSRSKSTR